MRYQIVFLAIWLSLICFPAVSQEDIPNFIVKDSIYQQGELERVDDNRVRFRKTKKDLFITYTARDISEYGYESITYRTLSLSGYPEFYQEVYRGKIKIYAKGSSFVFEDTDGVFKPLNRSNYRSIIASRVNCPPNGNLINRLRLAKKSLNYGLTKSALNNCDDYMPRMMLGLAVGLTSMSVNGHFQRGFGTSLIDSYNFSSSGSGLVIGGFIEAPLYKTPKLYLNPEIYYFNSSASLANNSNITKFAMDIQISGFMIPLNLKLLLGTDGAHPYLKGGLVVSMTGFSAKNNRYTETDVSATGASKTTNIPFTSSSVILIGLDAAAGLEIPIDARSAFILEARYVANPTTTVNNVQVGYSIFNMMAGVSF